MKIQSISIQNFKSFGSASTEIEFNDLTVLVGGNSSGKSNVLRALDLFFDYSKTKVTKDCFHNGNIYEPITIGVIFDQLTEKELINFQKNISQDKKLRITQKIWINPLNEEPEGGDGVNEEKTEDALGRVEQEKRGIRLLAVEKDFDWLNVSFLPSEEQVQKWWNEDLSINSINLKDKWTEKDITPTPQQYKKLVDDFLQEHLDDIPQIEWLNIEKVPSKTSLQAWWKNDLIVNGENFKNLFDPEPSIPEPQTFYDTVQKYWNKNINSIPVVYFDASEKMLGWANKLKGNLPRFIFIPAIRHFEEDIKTTKTSLFGILLNWLLGDITQTRKIELQKKLEDAITEVFSQKVPEGEKSQLRIDRIRETINRLVREQFDISLDFEFLPPSVDDILIGNAELVGNDGYRSSISEKGQGVQRSVIFALLRTYCEHREELEDVASTEKRLNIFAFEEPEICLHPSVRRATYNLLRNLSQCGNQVVYTTHDGYMVDVRFFDEVRVFKRLKKESEDWITKVSHFPIRNMIIDGKYRYGKDLPEEGIRERFSHFYDATKNEGFFAEKIILVEGPTEEYSLPIYFDSLGFNIDQSQVAIISAGSVQNLDYLYIIFNELGIPCYLVFDADKPADFDEGHIDPTKEEDLRSKSKRNKELLKLVGDDKHITDDQYFFPSICDDRLTIFEYKFEIEINRTLTRHEEWKAEATKLFGSDSKPLIARYIARKAVDAKEIPAIIPQILANVKACQHHGTCLMLEKEEEK